MTLLSIGIIGTLVAWLITSILEAGNRRAKYISIASWIVAVIAYNYFFAWVLNVSAMKYCIFDICLPFVLAALLGLPIAILLDRQFDTRLWGAVLSLVLIVVVAMGRPVLGTIGFIEGTSPAIERFSFQLLNVISFALCLVIPMLMLTPPGTRPWNYWLAHGEAIAHWPWAKIAIAGVAFLAITVLGVLVFTEHKVGLREYRSFGQLVGASSQIVLPLILVNHFVSFGLTKKLTERISANVSSGLIYLCLAGLVFAVLHYYLFGYYLITKFLAGVVFAYLYDETGSLGYGIVLNCLVLIFLA